MHHRSTEVLGMRTSAYKFPSGRKLTRMPHLASPLLRINLAEELRRLRSEQSWKRGSGRSSKTLAKYPDFHMVLVLMKANTQMHKHHVDARISIQALEGRLRVRLETQKPNGQTEADEVVETQNRDLKRPLLINARALTAEQQQKSDKRIRQFVRNPATLRKSLNEKNQDAARSQRLLKMLPDAFHFNYGERRGDIIQLNFAPNPSFHPPTHEAEVFHAMEGSVWVNGKEARVEEITGHLIHEVKFGRGLLGHLNKGGTFDVKQAEVARGY